MRHLTRQEPPHATQGAWVHTRAGGATDFFLKGLAPSVVVDAVAAHAGFFAEDAQSVGRLREACPHCGVPLQLVLRYKHVIRTHLYCESCRRCFDACLADGSSALTRPALPVE